MSTRRVGIKDVATHAGVSVGTVSNVLNQPDLVAASTRQAVLDAIDDLGFVRNGSASRLRSARSTVVGLVVLDVGNPFFTEVARGADAALQRRGYTVMLCNSAGDATHQRQHLRFLEEQRVAGVLITPVDYQRDRRDLDRLRERGLPVVLVDEHETSEHACSVAVDDVRGGELVGEHLLTLGSRRIVYVTSEHRVRQCVDRGDGLGRAVAAGDPTGAVSIDYVRVPDLNGQSGHAVVGEILTKKPDAIFCANDLVALGVLRGLFEANVSVPDDIALVGFDDIDFAQLASVPLTSVRQPAARMGETAAELLIDETGGHHDHQRIVFSPDLIVRHSTDLVR